MTLGWKDAHTWEQIKEHDQRLIRKGGVEWESDEWKKGRAMLSRRWNAAGKNHLLIE